VSRFSRINRQDEIFMKADAEYVKTVNSVEVWKAPAGHRLFARRGTEIFFAGAFSPLSYAEVIANEFKR
jgi:hypothetical protein